MTGVLAPPETSAPATPLQGGCDNGSGGTQPFQQCVLLAANCTGAAAPPVATTSPSVQVMSGESCACLLLCVYICLFAMELATQICWAGRRVQQMRLRGARARPLYPSPLLPASGHALPYAGFPVLRPLHYMATLVSEVPGRAIEGADFECQGTLEPGRCVYANLDEAVYQCFGNPKCESVVVFTNGERGRRA